MSSYYKKINGKNYDKSMLDIAAKSVKGKGDGRISLADARNIVKAITDGGKITDIEKRTLNYILEKYKLTETALKHIEKSLSDNMDIDAGKNIKAEKVSAVQENITQVKKESSREKSRGKLFLILILLLVAIFAVFAIVKHFYKNGKIQNIFSEKKDEISSPVKDEKAATIPAANKTEVEVKPLSENEYLIKDKDTLIKISESLYGDYKMWDEIYKLNKGKITNPNILYSGQVLTIPKKK